MLTSRTKDTQNGVPNSSTCVCLQIFLRGFFHCFTNQFLLGWRKVRLKLKVRVVFASDPKPLFKILSLNA